MNSHFHLLYPDQDGPNRIANRVISALSILPCVRRIALFGSLAENRADRCSDVDIRVAVDDIKSSQWIASTAIRSAFSVLYYRKFTSVDPPSGRYWFVGESPFHRLDIGFISMDEYQACKEDPEHFGYKMTLVEVCASDKVKMASDPIESAYSYEPATEYETEICSYIYFSIRAIKQHLRGECVQEKDLVRIGKLRKLIPSIPMSLTMSGGRIGELADQVYKMLDYLRLGL